MEFGVGSLFLIFVAVSALVISKAGSGTSDTQLLDPKKIQQRLMADKTLSADDRAYISELAVLELPRRHLIC